MGRLVAGLRRSFDLGQVREALGPQECLAAAIAYYRVSVGGVGRHPTLDGWQVAVAATPPQPLLHLHGSDDACIGVERASGLEGRLAPGSRVEVLDGVGHVLHLEQPGRVADLVAPFLTGA